MSERLAGGSLRSWAELERYFQKLAVQQDNYDRAWAARTGWTENHAANKAAFVALPPIESPPRKGRVTE